MLKDTLKQSIVVLICLIHHLPCSKSTYQEHNYTQTHKNITWYKFTGTTVSIYANPLFSVICSRVYISDVHTCELFGLGCQVSKFLVMIHWNFEQVCCPLSFLSQTCYSLWCCHPHYLPDSTLGHPWCSV